VKTLSVWAPAADVVEVETRDARHRLRSDVRSGWWIADLPIEHGDDYAFVLDDGDALPDPRSRWQPHGVHAASRWYDHELFEWSDAGWRGVRLAGSVVYEMHVGTFTPTRTFDSAIQHLDHLVRFGVDLVEVMPVAAFDGTQGWGYDGVSLFAVHEPYGGPDGFKRFVDACHARGLGVVLDVVYNHLGPSGNYLPRFGPYFTDHHHTPWGAAVNLDDVYSNDVRRFVIDNALSWLRDFHVDGLRLDAVHELVDGTATHLLEELAGEVDALSTALGRPLSLVAESDLNDARLVTAREAGGYGLAAQWNDDFHHALHAMLTGEQKGIYADFGSLATFAKAMTQVFVHDGTWSSFRRRRHGRPVDVERLPGYRFVAFVQDHDQIGNRSVGDRISVALSDGLLRIGAALMLTSPFTPMLFMGEEWAASTPWQFFSSFPEPALARAISEGRRLEFAEHGWDVSTFPDPQSPETVARSTLDWEELDRQALAASLSWYAALIALRRREADLTEPRLHRVAVSFDEEQRWLVVSRGALRVVCNLARQRQSIAVTGAVVELLLSSDADVACAEATVELPAESVAIVRVASPAGI
jgi:maltooligosyltrehalose trehalohydrolase